MILKSMSNTVFAKTMENVRKNRDINLATTEGRRNYLIPEQNYHTTIFFSENLVATKKKKTQIFMNKPVHLGVSILEISKIVMYEFWYDYMKLKYGGKGKLCYMDTYSFIVYIKTEEIYIDIVKDVEM